MVSCGKSKIVVTINGATSLEDASTPNTSPAVIAGLQNYILVPGNATLGTSDFYIMKYEAKAWADDNVDDVVDAAELDVSTWTFVAPISAVDKLTGSHIPVSTFDGKPWKNIALDAWDLCDGLNSEGTRANIDSNTNNDGTFALTSNLEYMTIARNIEVQGANWTSGVVGTDCLKRGNMGGAPSCNGIDSDFSDNVATTSSTNPLAKLVLSNGEEVWDLVGSLGEWVDWDTTTPGEFTVIAAGDKANDATRGAGWSGPLNFNLLDTNVLVSDVMFPDSFQPADTGLTHLNGVGLYVEHNSADHGAPGYDGAAFRGGFFQSTAAYAIKYGLYSLDLRHTSTQTNWTDAIAGPFGPLPIPSQAAQGFRCVYRP